MLLVMLELVPTAVPNPSVCADVSEPMQQRVWLLVGQQLQPAAIPADHRPPTTAAAKLLPEHLPEPVHELVLHAADGAAMPADLCPDVSANLSTGSTDRHPLSIVGILVLMLVGIHGLRWIVLPCLSTSTRLNYSKFLKNLSDQKKISSILSNLIVNLIVNRSMSVTIQFTVFFPFF